MESHQDTHKCYFLQACGFYFSLQLEIEFPLSFYAVLCCVLKCAVPENIHTHPMEGGGGSQQPKFLKESVGLNLEYPEGGGGGFKPKSLL